ncbi:uncharacterized protein KY384_007851 [Bacidia gigantensis]|uniref:uncharacterized protein n=1 Tax=Bacidia gigantensis TaxID=2732470 RepID=UPI001D0487D2|nr:uncharacterized protein KY384_007851 [Bacidia gigantensis]KAG8527697.1 hypothetical protein KY384_007851 [Bacidia gigantensis]
MLAPQEPLATQRGTQHQRWCTTREHRNVFRTFAGFAKHEKEHDDFYQFLPQGPVEKTSSGRQCALCTTKDPSEAHLQDHNILRYEGRLRGAITRSRKVNFEHLLKRHNTPEEYIKVLVDRWRKPAGKKTYSCGFCVAIFPTLPDRSSHIDREHFAKGQHIDDWDDFKVIKGLLLQPEVRQECQRLFNPVDPSRPETKISWPPSKIDALRLRLEIGSDPASELARDAFREARIDRLRPSTPNMRLLSDDRGHTHMPPSNQIHFAFGREIPTTSPHHDQLGLPRDTSSVQTAAKSDETAALDISLMSVPSPPEDLPPMVTSHGYPTRSSSLATRAACDSDFEFSGSANPFEAQHLSSVSQMMHNDLPQQDASDGALSQAEKPFLSPSISNYSFHQHSPYVLSTAGTPSHIAFQINSLEKETFNTSLEESAVPIPLPKRKLSDKSANDANLKAQTQAPSSTFNQDYSTEYGDLAYANTNVFEHWDSSYRM